MEIAVVQAPPEGVDTDVVAFPMRAPAQVPGAARGLDRALEGRLAALIEDGELTSERYRVTLLHSDGLVSAPRVVAVGIGDDASDDADLLRTAAAAAARRAGEVGARTIAWLLEPDAALSVAEQARAVVEGTALGPHQAGRWKTNGKAPPEIERLVLCGPGGKRRRRRGERARTSSRGGRTAVATS